MTLIDAFNELREQHLKSSIVLGQVIQKEDLFRFVDLYITFYSASPAAIIKIIATPDCSAQELNELILENCYKNYAIQSIPQNLSHARRHTWGIVDQNCNHDACRRLVVIAHAQNLTNSGLKEVEDLNARWKTSFLLARNTTSRDWDSEFAGIFANNKTPTVYIPPARITEPASQILRKVLFQGISVDEAFTRVQLEKLLLTEGN
ncbi:hypothetical protein FD723_40070 (plasmid) [Nostoc sp. C052]|uniref:hypothetical protein n=1 Tax=Nostoc sp. C052 TaxID=2576902 RepID=UPI0015C36740|nr:hypothetical protein [Nostoc sp. C052]QLE46411.1 hypothetical protein FD723_40070 [Nostoc sp. C052]